jgi:hypothetical protein
MAVSALSRERFQGSNMKFTSLTGRPASAIGFGLLAVCSVGLWLERSAGAVPKPERLAAPGSNATLQAKIAGWPLHFEVNRGQADGEVRYLSRGRGFGLYLTDRGATLAMRGAGAPGEDAVVRVQVVGGRAAQPTGLNQLEGRSNYLVGSDAAQWRTQVENFASVVYGDVLPGVDMIYYGAAEGQLEYDLVLDPGRDPATVELSFEGAEALALDAGALTLRLRGGGELRQPPPVAYQLSATGEKLAVTSRYELRGEKRVGFVVGDFDRSLQLVIDPLLLYSSYIGSSSHDEAFAVATDSAGNTYIVGQTTSPLFPTINPVQPVFGGDPADAFIVKLNAAGSSFVYATYLGGNQADYPYAVTTDALGNAYVAGLTRSTNFPTVSALQTAAGGAQDGFVAKLNASGSTLVYSSYVGGAQDDYVRGIAVDAAGSAHLVGTTFSGNFPIATPLQATLNGSSDAFVSKLTASGSALAYSTFLGGSNSDFGNAITLNATGNAYVVGATASANFPTLAAKQPAFAGGAYDAFVSKLGLTGASFVYSTYLGGNFSDEAFGVGVGPSDSAIVVGDTGSTNFPTSGEAEQTSRNGAEDAFISSYFPDGSALIYSTYLGGGATEDARAVAVDNTGTAYVVGKTTSVDFPVFGAISGQQTYKGAGDAFFTAILSRGARGYSTYFGGAQADAAVGVDVEGSGVTHIAGNTLSNDMPTFHPVFGTRLGAQDAFAVRLPGMPSTGAVPLGSFWTVLLTAGALAGIALLLLGRRSARTA